ncbi:hypothetical protein L1887_00999 [Cichorium endivia]|nr:hypothetical protein L1887_00999 [Cichorium endivia]
MNGNINIVKVECDENLPPLPLPQRHSKEFVCGPFTPVIASRVKKSKQGQIWENLADTYHPQYRNKELIDLLRATSSTGANSISLYKSHRYHPLRQQLLHIISSNTLRHLQLPAKSTTTEGIRPPPSISSHTDLASDARCEIDTIKITVKFTVNIQEHFSSFEDFA